MDRQDAFNILTEYVGSPSLINHNLAVEAALRFYARKLNEDETIWSMTGLLHDFDWEIHPTCEEHPEKGAPILRERGVPEIIIQAILSHGHAGSVKRTSQLEKALFACDEITGLITAVALVRPSRSLMDLTSSSVKRKWKDKAFAAGANRDEITLAAAEFGIPLWGHVDNVIIAMREIASELGLNNLP